MPYTAEMILDSISSEGVRLTTMELCYPLIVHNELLTHRTLGKSDDAQFNLWLEFSRNSSSNRAIPSERIIKQVMEDPYYPLKPRYSSRGMIPGAYMEGSDREDAIKQWLDARFPAIRFVQTLQNGPKLAKQWRNRLLNPWQFITVVATANEEVWQHFFSLRNHEAAQAEIQLVAELAENVYNSSTPQLLYTGEWHTPYVTEEDIKRSDLSIMNPEHCLQLRKQISVAICASSSFLNQDKAIPYTERVSLFYKLYSSNPPHGSPFEHVAQAASAEVRSGNFFGWKQFRKELGI